MKPLFYIYLLLLSHLAIGQDEETELIENTISNQESEQLDNENITDDLIGLRQNPINVNDTTADYSLLMQYDLISPIQIEAIREYIRTYGPMLSTRELIAVPYISFQENEQLQHYVKTEHSDLEQVSLVNQLKQSRSSIILRSQRVLQQQRGFTSIDSLEPRYLGNPLKLYTKVKIQYRDQLSIGFLADQDSGEEFFKGSNKQGFDFYSAHLALKPKNKLIDQVILGDYEVKIGQGLLHWNGFLLGKGSDVTSVFQTGNRIRPYSSSNEFNYMRGASINLNLSPKVKSQVWISHKNIDTNIEQKDSTEENRWIRSIQTSGLHRTIGEIEDKRTSTEQVAGFNTEYHNQNMSLGLALSHYKYSDSLGYSTQDYQKYLPRGDAFNSISLHHSILLNRFYIFGETAVLNNRSWATLQGVQHFLNSGVKASLLFRRYGKEYRMPYAAAFSENTTVSNEEGIYLGLDYSPSKYWAFKTYYDVFQFPWKKFRVSRPSQGNEFFFQSNFSPNAQLELEWRTKWETKDIDEIGSANPMHSLTDQTRIQNRLELRLRPNAQTYLKTRLAQTSYKTSQKNEQGYLLFQDFIYTLNSQIPTKFYTRLSIFNTPSYDSRVYAYENDLLYNFFVPAYYDQGVRYYAMASIEPMDRLKFWLKFSETKFSNKETISSGNDLIDGNKRSDVKVQLQWKF